MSCHTRSGRRAGYQPSIAPRANEQRLQKFIAASGVDSRRNCERYILSGRVMVNNETVTNPGHSVHPTTDIVLLDGDRLRLPKLKYYLVNKPKGVLCTNRDPSGRPRAIDLVPDDGSRLFTVGRLDENTQGLLLLTNDGELAEYMAHPRYEVVRRYRAQVAGVPTQGTLAQLRSGMRFTEGYFRFGEVRFLKRRGRSAFLEIELCEGKNREVRRMLARCGHKVIHLQRVAFGPLRIGHLNPGQFRELRAAEVRELRDFLAKGPDKRPLRSNSRRNSRNSRKPDRHRPGKPKASASRKSERNQSQANTD